jgi:hypothetical protein
VNCLFCHGQLETAELDGKLVVPYNVEVSGQNTHMRYLFACMEVLHSVDDILEVANELVGSDFVNAFEILNVLTFVSEPLGYNIRQSLLEVERCLVVLEYSNILGSLDDVDHKNSVNDLPPLEFIHFFAFIDIDVGGGRRIVAFK